MEEDIDNGVEVYPEDENDINQFDHPDDRLFDWSEGPDSVHPPSPRSRRTGHSNLVGRTSTSTRKNGSSGFERNNLTRGAERKNSRKGMICVP